MSYVRGGQAIASFVAGILCVLTLLPTLINANDTPDWYARAGLTFAAVVLAMSAIVHFYAAGIVEIKE